MSWVVADFDLDQLIQEAGRAHVIPPREDPALLDKVRDPRVLARARELLSATDKDWRQRAILCIERIAYAQHDQETAELLLHHTDCGLMRLNESQLVPQLEREAGVKLLFTLASSRTWTKTCGAVWH